MKDKPLSNTTFLYRNTHIQGHSEEKDLITNNSLAKWSKKRSVLSQLKDLFRKAWTSFFGPYTHTHINSRFTIRDDSRAVSHRQGQRADPQTPSETIFQVQTSLTHTLTERERKKVICRMSASANFWVGNEPTHPLYMKNLFPFNTTLICFRSSSRLIYWATGECVCVCENLFKLFLYRMTDYNSSKH